MSFSGWVFLSIDLIFISSWSPEADKQIRPSDNFSVAMLSNRTKTQAYHFCFCASYFDSTYLLDSITIFWLSHQASHILAIQWLCTTHSRNWQFRLRQDYHLTNQVLLSYCPLLTNVAMYRHGNRKERCEDNVCASRKVDRKRRSCTSCPD